MMLWELDLERMPRRAAAEMLATLELTTFPQLMKDRAKRVAKPVRDGVVSVVERAARRGGRTDLRERVRAFDESTTVTITPLFDKIDERARLLDTRDPDWVRARLRARICANAGTVENDPKAGRRVLEAAARELGIDPAGLEDGVIEDRIMQLLLRRLAETLSEQLVKATPEDEERIAARLEAQFQEMTSEQLDHLRRALGIDEVTSMAAMRALRSGGRAAALATAVQVGGFGAYVAVTSIMHAVFTSLLGITLPFGFYTGASSVIALLAGPFAIVLVAGTWVLVGRRASRKLERALLPYAITAIRIGAAGGAVA